MASYLSSIAEIERLVAADVAIADLDDVFARLSELAADDPIRAGTIADLIISHELENDRLARAEDDIMALAAALLAGGRTEEQEIGRGIQGRMRSRGFRGSLDPGPNQQRRRAQRQRMRRAR